MSRDQRVLQRRPRTAQPQREPGRLDRPPLDLARLTYLTVRQTMDYLQLPSEKAVYCWADRCAVPKGRVGRLLRFKRTDLDQALKKAGKQVSA